MLEIIPLLTGTVLAIVQGTMLFPGTFFMPVILCVFSMGAYMMETARTEEVQYLSFNDISMFNSKEEYIRSFQPDYIPSSAATAGATPGLIGTVALPIVAVGVAVASFFMPATTVLLNAGFAACHLGMVAKQGDLRQLRPTFGMAFFIVTFGTFAWQSSILLAGVLPLAVFFLKTPEVKTN